MSRPVPAAPGRLRVALAAAVLLVTMLPAPATATVGPAPSADGPATPALSGGDVRLTPIASGLDRPVFITSARDGSGRTFIVEQGGRILVRKNGVVLSTPLLDISDLVAKGGEQGLLGLAFHPSFDRNRTYFVNYTNRDGDTIIRRYRTSASNPDRTDPTSAETILKIHQPYDNHNGGMLAFGPGGYLYIAMGDGGGGDDPGNRAQRTGSLLGKMLRIDVNGSLGSRPYRNPLSNPYVGRTGLNEIWQTGLRNPWRFSFDRKTGTMWIGDVGQASYEEVDRAIHTDSGSGRGYNWGWRVMEGRHCHIPSSGCNTSGKKLPIAEYTHNSNGRCAITGGYVYRGSLVPALAGYYVYGDFCSGEIWAIKASSSSPATPITLVGPGSGRMISSFGESATGELFVVDHNGTISVIEAD
jgi:glucose/arabinose dehydrogenase